MGANDRLPLLERSRMPLYLQLETLLRRRLEAGEWGVGDQIPTIEQLCGAYRVSRVTLREALAQLEKERLITRGRGRGTFVTSDARPVRWLILPTDWNGLVEHIEKLHSRVVLIGQAAPQPPIEPQDGEPAAAYWNARRINFTASAPYSFTTIYLARDVYRRNPRGYAAQPVLPLLARQRGIKIGRASQVLTVTSADVETANLLELEVGAPVAEVRRVVCDRKERVIYLAEVAYPSRHLRIETTLLAPRPGRGKT